VTRNESKPIRIGTRKKAISPGEQKKIELNNTKRKGKRKVKGCYPQGEERGERERKLIGR